MSKITKISGTNPASKNLRWVSLATANDLGIAYLLLNKANDIVGGFVGEGKIYCDEKYQEKYEKELRINWSPSRLLFVPQEKFLLEFFTQLSDAIMWSAKGISTCFHAKTKFSGFENANCVECGENVPPSLVMGFLLTQLSELNETLWEAKHNEQVQAQGAVAKTAKVVKE